MTENSYKTPCGCIHYFVNIIDKQKITLVFLPGLTADHRLFEKQIEYFEKKQNVLVWDAPSHALSRPFTNNYKYGFLKEQSHYIRYIHGKRFLGLVQEGAQRRNMVRILCVR